MKKIMLLLLLAVISLFANAQNITPDPSGIFCPGVPTVFTISVSGFPYYNPYVAGSTANLPGGRGIAITTSVSTTYNYSNGVYTTYFTFSGNFVDYAAPQSLVLTYKDANGTDNSATFTYKNITSFYPAAAENYPQPTPASIQAISCQVQSFNISVPPVHYIDNYITGSSAYGLATNFEYILPNGWQLSGASTPSDGATWQAGTGNVTVTSDATHGGNIQIRAVPCSAGLTRGPISSIPISRPAPSASSYSINGPINLCAGTTANYSISGLPAGSTVSWAASPAAPVSIASPNATTTDISYVSNGVVTLTAAITDPCGNAANIGTYISAGIPTPTLSVTTYPAPAYAFAATATYIPGTTYAWYLEGGHVGGTTNAYTNVVDCSVRTPLYVQATNACGISTSTTRQVYITCNGGGGRVASTADSIQTNALSQLQHLTISPNPASGIVTVATGSDSHSKIFQIRVVDALGTVLGLYNYPLGIAVTTLNLSSLNNGLYILQTYDHNSWNSHLLLIKK
jgi:hypothetical protein